MAEQTLAVNEDKGSSRLAALSDLTPHLRQILALTAAIALSVAVALWAIRPSYVPLNNNLSHSDVAGAMDALRTENIPFEIDQRNGSLLVPRAKLQKARLRLAELGVANTDTPGLEMLQLDNKLGTSQFMESARYQRALEVELSRTIAQMRNIDTARVHLALPKSSVFVRTRAKSSGSVMVKLLPGRTLEDGQALAIVQMVAASVPYLESSEVTLVDQWGRLLSSNIGEDGAGAGTKGFEYARKLEETYVRRIENLLTPILGPGRVRAEVHAEVDFSSNERTEERYAADPTKVRSEQIERQSGQAGLGAAGVPGALANQPPPPGGNPPTELRNELNKDAGNLTRNYELDKTISHTRVAPGAITRISVAVVVDDRVSVNEAGETVREPLEQAELAALRNLVNEAVGFNAERGDRVVLSNRSFKEVSAIEPPEPLPIWQSAWVTDAAKLGFAALVVGFVLLGVVRPALRARPQTSEITAVDTTGNVATAAVEDLDDDKLTLSRPGDSIGSPPHVYGDILNLARGMANDDPKRVATVVKAWLQKDE